MMRRTETFRKGINMSLIGILRWLIVLLGWFVAGCVTVGMERSVRIEQGTYQSKREMSIDISPEAKELLENVIARTP